MDILFEGSDNETIQLLKIQSSGCLFVRSFHLYRNECILELEGTLHLLCMHSFKGSRKSYPLVITSKLYDISIIPSQLTLRKECPA